ncbi:YdcF family protein [Oscillatoria sp. FACHB-1406]|uniref:YdcF family protein n=1 Tax=Oscillatoria sp. FACHB-1406 TaxID=2692846 RepID=UPI0016878141|nr:YdcF family protein [Oscillatoria sp. FACHB-1406]MBD2577072.1 YdcF family protein [Oscillatoria sp. FACHB-1406]
MFVFLSKLLPIFLFPLGFACLLLIIALILLWFRSRWATFPVAFALIALLLSSNGWTSNAVVRSLETQNLPAEIPTADAIIVLGGALRPISPPRTTVEVSEQGDRALYAAYLYKQQKAPYIIASGGRVQWRGGGPSEASDMADFLNAVGVPRSAILLEPDSLNTYENAANTRKIIEQRGFKQILLVTSALHMPRSLAIFKKQGIQALPAPTDFLVTQLLLEEPSAGIEGFILNLLPEVDRLQRTTQAIKEYVGFGIYRLKGWL